MYVNCLGLGSVESDKGPRIACVA